jgi:hypothetical protein
MSRVGNRNACLLHEIAGPAGSIVVDIRAVPVKVVTEFCVPLT